jgi:hypothetical protein
MKLKWLRPDVISALFVIIGAVLLALTIIYRVNPVEGSVVDPQIRGTALHLTLLYTTMPAWIAGVSLCGALSASNYECAVLLMFLFQVLIYYALGKITKLILAPLCNRCKKSPKTP